MNALVSRLERAVTRSRLGVISLIGIILVPLVAAGVLTWALWNPDERLGEVTGAIVNEDEMVTLDDGSPLPLGRVLAGELVKSGSEVSTGDATTNYTWVITDAEDAAEKLSSGDYAATITIPKNFSADAASWMSAEASTPTKSTIEITTSERSKLVDDAISNTIAQAASASLGTGLTKQYLSQLYLGFNTTGEQLGEAANGARQIADGLGELNAQGPEVTAGARGLADGLGQLSGGVTQLSDGAGQLSGGAGALRDGTRSLNDGARQLGAGSGALVGGLDQLNREAAALPQGLGTLASGAEQTAAGTRALVESSKAALDQSGTLVTSISALEGAAQGCAAQVPGTCEALTAGLAALRTGIPVPENPAAQKAELDRLAAGSESLAAGARQAADSATALPAGIGALLDGARQLDGGVRALSEGTAPLASGAEQLATGAAALNTGLSETRTGVQALAEGSGTLATGMDEMFAGIGQLTTGSDELAGGLEAAIDKLPHYTEQESTRLADVVSSPVETGAGTMAPFGAGGAPLFAVLALWLGALASFVVLRAIPAAAVGSTRSSAAIALRAALVPLALGLLQGGLVTVVLLRLLDLPAGEAWAFGGAAALVGAAFAAVNQALIAVFDGIGRFLSMIVLVVTLAVGIISTVPGALTTIAGFLPIAPADTLLRSIATGTGGTGIAAAGVIVWLLGSLVATTLAIAARRRVSVAALRPATA